MDLLTALFGKVEPEEEVDTDTSGTPPDDPPTKTAKLEDDAAEGDFDPLHGQIKFEGPTVKQILVENGLLRKNAGRPRLSYSSASSSRQSNLPTMVTQQKSEPLPPPIKPKKEAASPSPLPSTPPQPASAGGPAGPGSRRSRPERGRFTMLDEDAQVAHPDAILDLELPAEVIALIFTDTHTSAQFLARYGLIPNMRQCPVEECAKEQLLSLIKHAQGYVWRCRSCRKRKDRRLITKVSIYDNSFLFYSRIPHVKLFMFIKAWSEHPGSSVHEYNRVLGEHRLVDETINNTVAYIRDHVQLWVEMSSVAVVGEPGGLVEVLVASYCEDIAGTKPKNNRKDRLMGVRIACVSLSNNAFALQPVMMGEVTTADIISAISTCVVPGTTVVFKDSFIDEREEQLAMACPQHKISTLSAEWESLDSAERERQMSKTLMERQQPAETGGLEYLFRRTAIERPFQHTLRMLRQVYKTDEQAMDCLNMLAAQSDPLFSAAKE